MQNTTLAERYKKYIKEKKKKSLQIDLNQVDKIAKILCASNEEIDEELTFLKKRR